MEPIAEHLLSWAMDAWADAVYDIVQPENAMWPDIEVALIVFEDASCLFYRHAAPPREATLSDGLRAMAGSTTMPSSPCSKRGHI